MSSLTGERILLPTRAELRTASVWVWVLLAIALLAFLLALVSDIQFGISAISIAAFAAAPAVVAAALIFVAPRPTLVRIAAFGFVVPVILGGMRVFLDSGAAEPNTISADYALLVPRLREWTDALSSVAWISTAVGVAALTLYIGRVATIRGWAIVALTTLMAVALFAYAASAWIPLLDPEFGASDILPRLIIGSASTLALLAWGFLAAVSFEHRLWLIAAAAGAHLLGYVPSLLTFALGPPLDLAGASLQLLLAWGWITSIVTWTALIAGVLLELPRHGQTIATDRNSASSQELLSRGQ